MKKKMLVLGGAVVVISLLISFLPLVAEKKNVGKRQKLLDTAMSYLGSPYKYGGNSTAGIDCSGFVLQVAKQSIGMNLPRKTSKMAEFSIRIADEQLQAGDLLFFNTIGRISHVGIYLGDGKFIHSASDGPRTGVIISKLSESYWKKTYRFAGRIVKPE